MSTRKVAAAEGMPEINRRSALVMGASLAATSIAAVAVSAIPADAAEIEPLTAEQRLEYHAKQYALAAREIDPTATDVWIGRAVCEDASARFYISVSRQFVTPRKTRRA